MRKIDQKRMRARKVARSNVNAAGDTTPPLAVSVAVACQHAGVGRSLLYRAIGAGDLRAIKAGKRTLIRVADIEAWLGSLPTIRATS